MGKKQLLGIPDLHREYGLGKATCYALMKKLPHLWVGNRLMVRAEDLDTYLEQASRERRDVRAELGIKRTKADFVSGR